MKGQTAHSGAHPVLRDAEPGAAAGQLDGGGRGIGSAGTAARAIVGAALVGSVVWGHVRTGVEPWPWVLGLGVFPAWTVAWQRRWARCHPERLVAWTGPVGHVVTFAVFMALYLTWWYAPGVSVLSDAALLFYGATMLAAALRGYAGCEVLAFSNWVLRRDDQVGCLLFEPLDRAERVRRR